jgi:uncharacterized protein YciI
MPAYIVQFEDNEDFASERKRHMAAHLGFLDVNAAAITAAGPLLVPDTGAGAGGLWLVTADSSSEVEALVHADPFWPTGLRKSFRVLQWKQVFKDGKRMI